MKQLNIRTREVVTNPNYLYIILDKAELEQGGIHTKENLDKIKFKTRDKETKAKGKQRVIEETRRNTSEQGDKPLVP